MSKVVLITGASSGLGLAIADYLAKRNFIVYGTSRNISGESYSFKSLQMDVGSTESIKSAIAKIVQTEGKIDVVINNAGLGIAGPVEHLVEADVVRVFDTNFLGVIRVCQAVLPKMREQKTGLIINVSSIGSEMGLPYRGAYSASKAALDRLTEAMRIEVKKYGIQACIVQPGGVATDISKNRLTAPLPADSVYKESFDRTYTIINESVSYGLPPESFGPEIEKIIKCKKVKRIYRIGKVKEKLSVLVKKLVSSHMFDNILRKHYKI